MTSQVERRQVYFSGRVQGVGFRYTAHQIAQSYAVTGFVKNLDDGRVELVAEGPPVEIDRYLADLYQRMGQYIRGATTTASSPTGQFEAFDIAY